MDVDRRNAVLEGVRNALGSTRRRALPASPRPPYRAPGPAVSAFLAACARVNSDAEVVPGTGAVASRVLELTRGVSGRCIAMSPRAAGPPWNLASVLAGTGSAFTSDVRTGDVSAAAVGITVAEYALADTGTVVSLTSPQEGRLESVLPPMHIAIVPASVILPDMWALFAEVDRRRLLERHSSMVFITGPSRTADIELTLTIGVHGPKRLCLLVVDDSPSGDPDAKN